MKTTTASPLREELRLKPGVNRVQTLSSRVLGLISACKTLVYESTLVLISIFPTRISYRMACALGRIRYRRQQQGRVRLSRAMQTRLAATPQEAEKWIRRYFELKSWEEVETWHWRRTQARHFDRLIEFEGLENLDNALAGGKGAVLCWGHFRGVFALMLGLAGRGYRLNAIRRKPLASQNRIGRWFNEQTTLMRQGAFRYLWVEPDNLKVAVETARALRRNEVVLVLLDGRFLAQSVDVKLLGQTVAIPSGPILIAQKTGSPLLNLSVHFEDYGRPHHVAAIGPPFYPASDVAASVQTCVSKLEEAIIREPASWIWYEDRTAWDGHQK